MNKLNLSISYFYMCRQLLRFWTEMLELIARFGSVYASWEKEFVDGMLFRERHIPMTNPFYNLGSLSCKKSWLFRHFCLLLSPLCLKVFSFFPPAIALIFSSKFDTL